MRSPLLKVAAIHDLSGFGRTSLTVAIPIFSAMGIQACPLPTAVLSTQTTGFDDFRFVDLTLAMRDFLTHWQELGLKFDAIYSGFLGSAPQAGLVEECMQSCLKPGGLTVVDPVLGDNGKLDPTMTPEMVNALRHLAGKAMCITPNLTEAALLLDEPFPEHLPEERLKEWLRRLADLGPEIAVITSAQNYARGEAFPTPATRRGDNRISVAAYEKSAGRFWKVTSERIPAFYPGTGDTFTSVLTAALMRGDSLPVAMDRAAQFVTLGIRETFGYNHPCRDGILLERALPFLRAPLAAGNYELLDEDEED